MGTTTQRKGKSDVATKEDTTVKEASSLVTIPEAASVPAMFRDDIEQYAGAGTGHRAEEQLVPFVALLQKTSPQVNDRDPGYVKGSKAGMLMNAASLRLWDAEQRADGTGGDGMVCVQFYSEMAEVEWIPRSAGGGFVARHDIDTPLLKDVREVANPDDPSGKRKSRMLPNGHQLVTTAYHYLLLVETLEPVIVGLKSTGLQTHRRWNQMLLNKRVSTPSGLRVMPTFATLLRLRTFWQSNDQGDWFSIKAEDIGWLQDRVVYEEAKRLHKQAAEGAMRMAADPAVDPEGATAGSATVERPIEDDDSPL